MYKTKISKYLKIFVFGNFKSYLEDQVEKRCFCLNDYSFLLSSSFCVISITFLKIFIFSRFS